MYGLFVTRPGYDALTSDVNAHEPWLFNSHRDKLANIMQSGQVGLNTVVTHPDIGVVPMVMFDRYDPATGTQYDNEAVADANNLASSVRYIVTHHNNTQFSITRGAATSTDPNFSGYFRYLVFQLPQDGG